MVADMFEPGVQQDAANFVVLASCSGSVIAPIFGGIIQTHLDWRWIFWIQLIFGAVAQLLHFFVPETRSDVLLDIEAKRLRKTGENTAVYGPNEVRGTFWQRTSIRHIGVLMIRPYKFLVTEPIVGFLSLLSGFSDALIFMGLDSFPMVLSQWGFDVQQSGFAFTPLLLGYLVAFIAFKITYKVHGDPDKRAPEHRLWLLLWVVPLEPIGLVIFGFSALGPPQVHWMGPLIGSFLVGIANYAIYQATV